MLAIIVRVLPCTLYLDSLQGHILHSSTVKIRELASVLDYQLFRLS